MPFWGQPKVNEEGFAYETVIHKEEVPLKTIIKEVPVSRDEDLKRIQDLHSEVNILNEKLSTKKGKSITTEVQVIKEVPKEIRVEVDRPVEVIKEITSVVEKPIEVPTKENLEKIFELEGVAKQQQQSINELEDTLAITKTEAETRVAGLQEIIKENTEKNNKEVPLSEKDIQKIATLEFNLEELQASYDITKIELDAAKKELEVIPKIKEVIKEVPVEIVKEVEVEKPITVQVEKEIIKEIHHSEDIDTIHNLSDQLDTVKIELSKAQLKNNSLAMKIKSQAKVSGKAVIVSTEPGLVKEKKGILARIKGWFKWRTQQ